MMNTLFIGHHISFLDCVDSTNNYAAKLINEGHKVEGTVIVADEQHFGRGRGDKKWLSQPGVNLLASFILKPTFIKANHAFALSKIASLGVYNALKRYNIDVEIKWPNDILTAKGKISGILIENQVRGSALHSAILGIGININQVRFPEPGISSLQIETGKAIERNDVLSHLCETLEAAYLRYKANPESIDAEYLERLHGLNQWLTYRFESGIERARMIGISSEGHALMERNSGLGTYSMDQVTLIRSNQT